MQKIISVFKLFLECDFFFRNKMLCYCCIFVFIFWWWVYPPTCTHTHHTKTTSLNISQKCWFLLGRLNRAVLPGQGEPLFKNCGKYVKLDSASNKGNDRPVSCQEVCNKEVKSLATPTPYLRNILKKNVLFPTFQLFDLGYVRLSKYVNIHTQSFSCVVFLLWYTNYILFF